MSSVNNVVCHTKKIQFYLNKIDFFNFSKSSGTDGTGKALSLLGAPRSAGPLA